MAQFPSTTNASDIWALINQYRAQAGGDWPGTGIPMDYLVVAGGGGGASGASGSGPRGGGGAGGAITGSGILQIGTTYNIVIGTGGSAATAGTETNGGNGGNSTFYGQTAVGGGGGRTYGGSGGAGLNGGSGGGSCYSASRSSGVTGQGNPGGISFNATGAGGGGGAGEQGYDATVADGGANGGNGIEWPTGSGNWYAGGGGSGGYSSNPPGNGGIGGGGNGTISGATGQAGAANTGGGGGGGGGNGGGGGAGGSGVVIIRTLEGFEAATTTGSPTVTVAGGYRTYKFTSDGSITFAAPPGPETADPYFSYVSMLLPTNGANGAQNNDFVDSSSNAFSITRSGNVTQGTFTPFGSNWSNHFDGAGDTLTVAQNTANDFGTGDFCVEAWVFPWQAGYIVLQRPSTSFSSGNWYIYGGNGDNAGAWNTRVGSSSDLTMRGVIPPNTWTHVCVTRSGNQGRFFSNGVLTGTATFAGSDSLGGSTVSIGDIASGTQNPFGGYISNVRLIKGSIPALYQTASTTIGATIFTPSTTPLSNVAGCGLLTCQSNRFKDNSSNNFPVTRNGDVLVQRFSPFSPAASYSTATNGGSAYFDGSDKLTMANNAAFDCGTSNDFCMEMWAYATYSTNSQHYWSSHTGGVANGFYFTNSTGAGRYPSLQIYSGGGGGGGVASNKLMTLGEWVHVCVTRQSGRMRVFLNGELTGTTTTTYQVNTDGNLIGINGGNNFTGDAGWYGGGRYINGSVPTAYQTEVITLNTQVFTPPTGPFTTTSQGATAAHVKSLVTFTNGGIIDASMMSVCETVGSAQLSTSAFQFGTASLYTGTSGSNCLTFPSTPLTRFYSGDFTVEGWFRPLADGTERTFFVQGINTPGGIAFFVGTGGARFRASSQTDLVWSGSISNAAFTHVAFVRYGTARYIYVNGSRVASDTLSFNNNDDTTLEIGAPAKNASDTFRYYGYIDDLRVSRFARYTGATLTVPTQAFSTY